MTLIAASAPRYRLASRNAVVRVDDGDYEAVCLHGLEDEAAVAAADINGRHRGIVGGAL